MLHYLLRVAIGAFVVTLLGGLIWGLLMLVGPGVLAIALGVCLCVPMLHAFGDIISS